MMNELHTKAVLEEVVLERQAQDERFGEQNHPNGTGGLRHTLSYLPEIQRRWTNARTADGSLEWTDILAEEVAEAVSEEDPVRLREELIQVAAVAVAWVESIDRATVMADTEIEDFDDLCADDIEILMSLGVFKLNLTPERRYPLWCNCKVFWEDGKVIVRLTALDEEKQDAKT